MHNNCELQSLKIKNNNCAVFTDDKEALHCRPAWPWCLRSDIRGTPLLFYCGPHNERILLTTKDNRRTIGPVWRLPGRRLMDIYVTFTWCEPAGDKQTVCMWWTYVWKERSDPFPFWAFKGICALCLSELVRSNDVPWRNHKLKLEENLLTLIGSTHIVCLLVWRKADRTLVYAIDMSALLR